MPGDAALWDSEDWFAARCPPKRVLKRLDLTARSLLAVSTPPRFAGSLMELALAADRSYMSERGPTIAFSD